MIRWIKITENKKKQANKKKNNRFLELIKKTKSYQKINPRIKRQMKI